MYGGVAVNQYKLLILKHELDLSKINAELGVIREVERIGEKSEK